jgi:hypothetical protein
MMTKSLLGIATVLTLSAAIALPAAAGFRRGYEKEGDVAYAVSRHGNGEISAPIRFTRTGREVRLPGGTWVGCRRSCSETLRVETIDIFENDGSLIGYGTFQNQCGIFGCLEIGYPR